MQRRRHLESSRRHPEQSEGSPMIGRRSLALLGMTVERLGMSYVCPRKNWGKIA